MNKYVYRLIFAFAVLSVPSVNCAAVTYEQKVDDSLVRTANGAYPNLVGNAVGLDAGAAAPIVVTPSTEEERKVDSSEITD